MPPQDTQAENALVVRMRQGDEAAFTTLYRRHRDGVYRFALLYSGSPAVAADVTQDAFVHFITQPDRFDPTRGTVGAWLCGVARNIARRHMAAREVATDPAELHDDRQLDDDRVDHDSPLERVLRAESAEQVRSRLSRARAQLAQRLAPRAPRTQEAAS